MLYLDFTTCPERNVIISFFFILISLCNNYNNIYNNIITNNYSLIFIWIFSLDLYRMSPPFSSFRVLTSTSPECDGGHRFLPFHFYYISPILSFFFLFFLIFLLSLSQEPILDRSFPHTLTLCFVDVTNFFRTILLEWRMIKLIILK